MFTQVRHGFKCKKYFKIKNIIGKYQISEFNFNYVSLLGILGRIKKEEWLNKNNNNILKLKELQIVYIDIYIYRFYGKCCG